MHIIDFFKLSFNFSNPVRPVVDISSSPENNRLPFGASVTLACTAEPRTLDKGYHDRWVNYIEWYDPQNKETGAKCRQPSNIHAHKRKLSCPLVLKNLTVDKFGRYTCQAGNGYRNYCTRKSFEIVIQGKQTRLVISLINNYSTSACWICDDRRPTRPIGPSWPSIIAYPKSASGTIIKSKNGPEHI